MTETKPARVEDLPQQAGSVPLRYFGDIEKPERRKDGIHIPYWGGVELFSLLGGKQYLVLIRERPHRHVKGVECSKCQSKRRKPGPREGSLYFIGEDDSAPFVAPLRDEMLEVFLGGGEQRFFEELKPPVIRELEAKWGKERTKRQGDIFAYDLQMTWEEFIREVFRGADGTGSLSCSGRIRLAAAGEAGHSNYSSESVLGTRHTLKNAIRTSDRDWVTFAGVKTMGLGGGINWGFVGSGTLEAPNHKPLVLTGPHIIAQAMILRQGTYSAD
ncbi:MAG: hypothetical protein HYT40_02055 [Candidatus Sungbacteria bacterium]|uniref:Uncharacterized protein n=1 Tax=Candidatus Sungiibacteriota bacterium TaxID=2750080 RepID=A0A931SDJ0_9BACT|nr:hypothetical protein [Candidatus Sungbacteria bacterium]